MFECLDVEINFSWISTTSDESNFKCMFNLLNVLKGSTRD